MTLIYCNIILECW